jgi:hypothetical protein
MTTIPDSELPKFASRAKGKVVLITGKTRPGSGASLGMLNESAGAAGGIGKETALLFGKHGYVSSFIPPNASDRHGSARVAIGDINEQACRDVADQVARLGGYVHTYV